MPDSTMPSHTPSPHTGSQDDAAPVRPGSVGDLRVASALQSRYAASDAAAHQPKPIGGTAATLAASKETPQSSVPSAVPRPPPMPPATGSADPEASRRPRQHKTLAQRGAEIAEKANAHQTKVKAAALTAKIVVGATLLTSARKGADAASTNAEKAALALLKSYVMTAGQRERDAILAVHPWIEEGSHA